jgi:hypothetical protein
MELYPYQVEDVKALTEKPRCILGSEEPKGAMQTSTKPISWEWLAGFFQAEGSAYHAPASGHFISIAQKDTSVLRLIGSFLDTYNISYSIYDPQREGVIPRMQVSTRQAEVLLWYVFPQLRSKKQTQLLSWAAEANVLLPTTPKPLDYDFVVGLYEGDGYPSYERARHCIFLKFYQHDLDLLEELKAFLQKGYIRVNSRNKHTRGDGEFHDAFLGVYANTEELKQLLPALRTDYRKTQLLNTIANDPLIYRRVLA